MKQINVEKYGETVVDRSNHTLACLFAQLGLENSEENIQAFISSHKGIPNQISLSEASCWNKAQANFLKDAINDDSDWSEIVDTLDVLLR